MAQSVEVSKEDIREIDRRLQRQEILEKLTVEQRNTISELETSNALLQKQLELEKRENELNQRIIAIKDQEIAAINRNFEQMKEVADRAIKLTEVSKPKSNWQLTGLLAAVAVIAGFILAK